MRFFIYTKGTEDVASSRFRGYALAAELRRQGHVVHIEPVPSGARSFISMQGLRSLLAYSRALYLLEDGDVLYLQRTIYNKFFFMAVLLVRIFCRTKYVFDIDDAVYIHSPLKTKIIVYFAAVVTCGGREIQEWVLRYNHNSFIFYNALSETYFSEKLPHDRKAVIGWIGNGPAHYENLVLLHEPLRRLVADQVPFSFRLIGALADQRIYALYRDIPGLDVDIVDELDWKVPEHTIQELDTFAIGVMPLTDIPWNHAKYMKTLEYMARGVVPVVSKIGENARIINSGENGLIALTPEDWHTSLKQILQSNNLRARLSAGAQLSCKTDFSLTVRTHEFIRILELHYA